MLKAKEILPVNYGKEHDEKKNRFQSSDNSLDNKMKLFKDDDKLKDEFTLDKIKFILLIKKIKLILKTHYYKITCYQRALETVS